MGGASSDDDDRDKPKLLPEMLGFACLVPDILCSTQKHQDRNQERDVNMKSEKGEMR